VYENSISQDSFNKAYETLYPIIFRVAYRIVGETGMAEDMCQEAFIKYYQRKEDLPDLNQTKYWLIRVVKNLSLNHEKRKSRERNAVDKLKKAPLKRTDSGEDIYLKKEARSAVQEALQQLPHKFRVVLILKEYAKMNYKEIGDVMKISEGNVKVRVFRAREKLAKLLKEQI
jgi:RNA polymerase sigma-70 factor (ECF subfamily)